MSLHSYRFQAKYKSTEFLMNTELIFTLYQFGVCQQSKPENAFLLIDLAKALLALKYWFCIHCQLTRNSYTKHCVVRS